MLERCLHEGFSVRLLTDFLGACKRTVAMTFFFKYSPSLFFNKLHPD